MPLKLYNTLTKKKENFKPLHKKEVRFYSCGPTVYQRAHLGNFRTYVNQDLLKRAFMMNGYKVQHVMNITDVGHLEADSDTGEDKVEKEARMRRKSAWDIAREYEKIFKEDLKKLNIIPPKSFPRATENIKEQIILIKKLEAKGLTYKTPDGIYFDTSRFKKYGVLVKEKLKGLKSGARVKKGEKRNSTDFALWKFSPVEVSRQMEWPSPWGVGFPGWHVECSAMSTKYLGLPIDIHAGGIDHIHPHHTNEIAQSEAAFGKKFVNFWMHSEFMVMGKTRMGKSEGNALVLDDLEKNGFSPLDFRYFVLSAHYRSPLSFSWKALEGSRNARKKLTEKTVDLKQTPGRNSRDKKRLDSFKKVFTGRMNNDLDVPGALGLLWKFLNASGLKKSSALYNAILFSDHLFGLGLNKAEKLKIPREIKHLLSMREKARASHDWKKADKIRDRIHELGFFIDDTPTGAVLKKAT
jgi:cysteinyl-tRNA synthetase